MISPDNYLSIFIFVLLYTFLVLALKMYLKFSIKSKKDIYRYATAVSVDAALIYMVGLSIFFLYIYYMSHDPLTEAILLILTPIFLFCLGIASIITWSIFSIIEYIKLQKKV